MAVSRLVGSTAKHARVLQVGETYDWRLAVPNMEKRDHYFTRLKWRIELTHQTNGEKVLLPTLPVGLTIRVGLQRA